MCGKMAMSASPSGGGHDFGEETGFLHRTVRQAEVARCDSAMSQGAM